MERVLILVTGDRNPLNEYYDMLVRELSKFEPETCVIHGGARGVDNVAGIVAKDLGFHVIEVKALWHIHGKWAGPIRNRVMLDLRPDLVLGFHRNINGSKGTKDCLEEAQRRGIPNTLISS